jgi:hypothetical protein
LIFIHLQSAYFTISVSCVVDLLEFVLVVCNQGDDKKDDSEDNANDGTEYISGTSFMVWDNLNHTFDWKLSCVDYLALMCAIGLGGQTVEPLRMHLYSCLFDLQYLN